jgi:hypothetical protein
MGSTEVIRNKTGYSGKEQKSGAKWTGWRTGTGLSVSLVWSKPSGTKWRNG